MDNFILVIMVILTVINLVLYHSIFKVYYFNLGKGIAYEIVMAFLISGVEIFLFLVLWDKVLSTVFSFAGTLFSWILKIAFIIAILGVVAFVAYKIMNTIKSKSETGATEHKKAADSNTEALSSKGSTNTKECDELPKKERQPESVKIEPAQKRDVKSAEETDIGLDNDSSVSNNECLDYEIELSDVGPNKVKVLAKTREVTGLGLKEAKEIVDNVPAIVLRGISEDEANKIKDMFELLGAKVTVISKAEMDGEQIICTNCGSRIKKQAKFCKYCGHENEDGGDEL